MDAEKFGTFLFDQRKGLGMTQKELAEKLGVTDKAVSKWERGGGLPDINMLEPLAYVLNVDLAELIMCRKEEKKKTEESSTINETIVEALEYAQTKIKKAKVVCTFTLVISWIAMLFGVCVLNFYIDNKNLWALLMFFLILVASLCGNVLRKLHG